MPRSALSSTDHWDATSAPETASPLAMGCWVNLVAANADAHFMAIGRSGHNADNTEILIGGHPSAAGTVGMYAFDSSGSGGGANAAISITTGVWHFVFGINASSTAYGYLDGANKGSKAQLIPASLGIFAVSRSPRPIDGAIAHGCCYNRAPNDIEVAYLGTGLGNPRYIQSLTNYWYFNTATGTEADVVGSIPLTITGTSSAASDPNIASFFTGTIANQSWTQGSAITAINLRTLFDLQGYTAGSELWTGTLKQLGTAGTATTASAAGTSTALLSVASATGITAGMFVKVGSNAFTWVLYVSGSTLLLATPLTWNSGDTVTPYPVGAVTALTSNGISVASNSVTGTPGAGAVGSYTNCVVLVTNNTNAGAIAYSNPFNVTVASSGAVPSFTAGPTLTATNTDGFGFGATSNQTATWWQGVYARGSAAPTAAQIIAGSGTGFVSHFSTSLTLNVAGSNTSTGLTLPIYDVYHCLTNGSGNSAVVAFTAQITAPPAGKQYVTVMLPAVTAITKANPAKVTANGHGLVTGQWAEIFGVAGMTQINGHFGTVTVVDANNVTFDALDSTGFTTYTSGGTLTWGQSVGYNASTVIATGDVWVADATTLTGYAVTLSSQGVPILADNGDLTRQQLTVDCYSVSLGALIGSVIDYVNDRGPVAPSSTRQTVGVFLPLNVATSYPIGPIATDPQQDVLTATTSSSYPPGLSGSLAGTPTVAGIYPMTWTWTNNANEQVSGVINVVVGNMAVPNLGSSPTGLTQNQADSALAALYLTATYGTQDDSNPAGPAPAGTVIAQTPSAGTSVLPNTVISVSLSSGNAAANTSGGASGGGGTTTPGSAVVIYSTQLQGLQTVPVTLGLGYLTGSNTIDCVDVCPTGSTDLAGSVYRYFRVPSNARIIDLDIMNDANPAGSSYRCGVYKLNATGTPVPGADAIFFNGVTMDNARSPWTRLYTPAKVGSAYQLANLSKRIWELLGLTADPNAIYELAITATTPGATGGMMALRLSYVQ